MLSKQSFYGFILRSFFSIIYTNNLRTFAWINVHTYLERVVARKNSKIQPIVYVNITTKKVDILKPLQYYVNTNVI